MIGLHHADMSTCAQKVRLALAEKELPWVGHQLNLRKSDQHRPEYLKLNPNGVVPTLVDDGRVVFTCAPSEFHYNPIGSVHGGLAATLIDSATG